MPRRRPARTATAHRRGRRGHPPARLPAALPDWSTPTGRPPRRTPPASPPAAAWCSDASCPHFHTPGARPAARGPQPGTVGAGWQIGGMTSIVLYHASFGVRPGIEAAADRLRAAGHQVQVVDQYGGRVFDDYDEADEFVQSIGFPALMAARPRCRRTSSPGRSSRPASPTAPGMAEFVTAARGGAAGGVLGSVQFSGALPLDMVGMAEWPADTPVQLHYSAGDPSAIGRWIDPFLAAVTASGSALETYLDYPVVRAPVHRPVAAGRVRRGVRRPRLRAGAGVPRPAVGRRRPLDARGLGVDAPLGRAARRRSRPAWPRRARRPASPGPCCRRRGPPRPGRPARPATSGVVPRRPAAGQQRVLLGLHLAGDPQDLQVVADTADVREFTPTTFFSPFSTAMRVGEGGVGDLAGEVAVLDAAQDARWSSRRSGARRTEPPAPPGPGSG